MQYKHSCCAMHVEGNLGNKVLSSIEFLEIVEKCVADELVKATIQLAISILEDTCNIARRSCL